MLNKIYRILIVDDDRSMLHTIGFPLGRSYLFEIVGTVKELWAKLEEDSKNDKEERFALLLLDLALNPKEPENLIGLDLLPELQKSYPNLPIIVVTNEKQLQTGLTAMKRGAKDFLTKDEYDHALWSEKFRSVIESSKNEQEVKVLRTENKTLREKTEYTQHPKFPFIGNSLKIESIRKTLKTLSDEEDLAVLILGETGVGKGVAARFLHFNSLIRRNNAFEEIHISTIPKDLLEGTLFGTLKGTFTGATTDQEGRLEMANKGTVFLDEIGELSLENQIKLLQFLETKTIRPTGSKKDILLDVQIVSATNKVLRDEVAKGQFRQDLYYRLKGYTIEIPPLRERRDDIEPLLMHFFKMNRLEELDARLEPSVKELLIDRYDWPGNIRELNHAVREMEARQRVLGIGKISPECLPEEILYAPSPVQMAKENVQPSTGWPQKEVMSGGLSFKEKQAWTELSDIEKALHETNGRKEEAAQRLGLKSSDNIYTRIKKYQVKYPHLVSQFPFIRRAFKTLF